MRSFRMSGRDASVETACRRFSEVFGGQKAAIVSRAAGRVELIGGHTDYNEGFILAAAIDKSCRVAAGERGDGRICFFSELAGERHEFELSKDLQPDNIDKWANYGRGVAALLLQEGLKAVGGNFYIVSDVPLGAGLSSSAALEVSIGKAMIALSGGEFDIEPLRLAQICQRAENVYANSPCGIMDQSVSIMGRKDSAVFMDCRDLSIRQLPFDSDKYCVMVFNSMVKHEVGGGEYGKRRKSCEQAVAILQKKFPQVKALRDADEKMLESVRDKLDSVQYKRARHVIGENARVVAAGESLKRHDMAEFGKLMNQSHASARDLYEISCPETDFLAEEICRCDGAFGARLSGGGFGGSVVALVSPGATEKIKEGVCAAYRGAFGLDSDAYVVRPAQGAEITRLA